MAKNKDKNNKDRESCNSCRSKDKVISKLEAIIEEKDKQIKKYKKASLKAKQRLNILEYQVRDHEEVAKEADFIAAREEIEGFEAELEEIHKSLVMVFDDPEEEVEEGVIVLTDLNGNQRILRAKPKMVAPPSGKRSKSK